MEVIPGGQRWLADGESYCYGPYSDISYGNVLENRKVNKENAMSLSAWIMFLAGCVILFGGLGLCIGIAVRKRNKP